MISAPPAATEWSVTGVIATVILVVVDKFSTLDGPVVGDYAIVCTLTPDVFGDEGILSPYEFVAVTLARINCPSGSL